MYVLYHFPFSQHARRVVSLLVEANLAYELRHVAMDKGEHRSPEYLAINPNHQVPTLLVGDIKIHESNAILRYLCAKHALDEWYPRELRARAAVEQWLDWNQCQLSPAVIDIVLNSVFLGDRGDPAAIERGRLRLRELAPILDDALASRSFLGSDRPTIADLSLASSVFQLTQDFRHFRTDRIESAEFLAERIPRSTEQLMEEWQISERASDRRRRRTRTYE